MIQLLLTTAFPTNDTSRYGKRRGGVQARDKSRGRFVHKSAPYLNGCYRLLSHIATMLGCINKNEYSDSL